MESTSSWEGVTFRSGDFAVSSSAGPGQFFPGLLNECSDRGILHPEQQLVFPMEVKKARKN